MFRVSPLKPSAGRHVDILNVKKFVSAQSIHFFDIISDFFSTMMAPQAPQQTRVSLKTATWMS